MLTTEYLQKHSIYVEGCKLHRGLHVIIYASPLETQVLDTNLFMQT